MITGQPLRPAAPNIVYLRIARTCNAKCPYCPSWKMPRQFPAKDLLLRIVDEVVEERAKTLVITGGEPALHPALFDLIAHARRRNLRVTVITNGMLFKGKLLSRTVSADISCLIASLDAPSSAVHDTIRALPGGFHLIEAGLRELRANAHNTTTQINMVVSSASIAHVSNAIALCCDLGVATLNLLPIKDHPALNCSIEQITAFNAERPSNVQLAREHGVQTFPPDLNIFGSSCESIRGSASGSYPVRTHCHVPTREAFIDAVTGDVWPCNSVPYENRELSLCGNVFEATFGAIWRSTRFDKIRTQLVSCREVSCSRKCDPLNEVSSDRYFVEERVLFNTERV